MHTVTARLLACTALLGLLGISLPAEAAERVRGAIIRLAGGEMEIKTAEGQHITLHLTDKTTVSAVSAIKPSAITAGSFVGITAVPDGPDRPLRALEVHLFPEAQRGTGEGHYDWDLAPGSTMTNANVDAVVQYHKGRELALSYQGGTQKIMVPAGVPIVAFAPADRSLLQVGAQVFAIVERAADGRATALRIAAGRDGVKPPM